MNGALKISDSEWDVMEPIWTAGEGTSRRKGCPGL